MRLKIGTKIGLVFFAFFLGIVVFIFIYLIIIREHQHHMQVLSEEVEEIDLIRELQVRLATVIMPANDFLILGAKVNEKENFKILSAKAEDLISRIDKLKFDRPEEREVFNKIKEKYLQVRDAAQKLFSFPMPVGNIEAGRLMKKMDAIAVSAINDCEVFRQVSLGEIKETQAGCYRITQLLYQVILGGALLNLISVLAAVLFFRRSISKPIVTLRDAAIAVGEGNLEKRVDIRANNEIGDLAASFNKMIEDLKKAFEYIKQRSKECENLAKHREEALLNFEVNISTYESEIKMLKETINKLLEELGRPRIY